MRREFEIGKGKMVNIEKSKTKVSTVEEGSEFGAMVESRLKLYRWYLESFSITQNRWHKETKK